MLVQIINHLSGRLYTLTVLEPNRSPVVTARYATSTAHSLIG